VTRAVARPRSEADLILADGDRVVVQAQRQGDDQARRRLRPTYCYVFRVRDGQLVEVTEHCDTALVERVLEPPAHTRPYAPKPARARRPR
jgi:ketosteroid isomerase-like protein